mmetsp:Transcript_23545/g.46825  ORF Transcript_23545/g.46825 Transcript_23545/m.46825 type:complete len:224 (-) Transcript_23545:110-781(-)
MTTTRRRRRFSIYDLAAFLSLCCSPTAHAYGCQNSPGVGACGGCMTGRPPAPFGISRAVFFGSVASSTAVVFGGAARSGAEDPSFLEVVSRQTNDAVGAVSKETARATKEIKKGAKKIDRTVTKEKKKMEKKVRKVEKKVEKKVNREVKNIKKEVRKVDRKIQKETKKVGIEIEKMGATVEKKTGSFSAGGGPKASVSSPRAPATGIDVSKVKACKDSKSGCL